MPTRPAQPNASREKECSEHAVQGGCENVNDDGAWRMRESGVVERGSSVAGQGPQPRDSAQQWSEAQHDEREPNTEVRSLGGDVDLPLSSSCSSAPQKSNDTRKSS